MNGHQHMNNLAKQLVDDDGDAVPYPSWHLVVEHCGDEAILCTGEFIHDASSSGNGSKYTRKSVKRGGITCNRCSELIQKIKDVRW
jgi:hypothetical protein